MTSARDLSNRLSELLRNERHAMAAFLVELAAFDRRKAWMDLGHPSLFSFLRVELGLSAGAAHYRKTAAELLQTYPAVEAALRTGKLCLSSVIELAKVVTPENAAEILPRFFGLSRREAASVAVEIRPVERPPMREVVTVPRPESGATPLLLDRRPTNWETDPSAIPLRPAETVPATPSAVLPRAAAAETRSAVQPKRDAIEPLNADLARLHITVSRRFLAKLEAARSALSRSRPGASSEDVLEACLDLLLAQHAKRRGLVEKPRKRTAPVKPGAIPAAVKREVWKRASGRCEFPLESGGVCGSRLRLEFDHVTPRANGGPSTIENLRLACRMHNQLWARRTFGDDLVARFARERATGRAAPPPPP